MVSSFPAAEREEWGDLARLAVDPLRENEFFSGLVEAYRRSIDASSAAIYLDRGGALSRSFVAGEGELPLDLDEDAGDLRTLEFPGGLVAWRLPAGEPSPWYQTLLSTALAVHELRRQLKRRGFEANLHGVELQALYEVGLAITSTLNLEQLSEGILLWAVSLLDARRGALYLVQADELRLGRTIGGDAVPTIAIDDVAVASLLAGNETAGQQILPDARFLQAVPIEAEGEPRGLIVVADKESRTGVGPFTSGDRRTLELFANQAAIALENARLHREALEKERLEREMELAAEIQQRLLPTRVPEIEGLELKGWSRPAQHVGGDYYDLITLKNGSLVLVVGDVSGKGMPAALMVSTVHSALRLLLDRMEVGPALLERLNRHIAETSAPNKFITFFMAEVDSRRREVQFLNAGHNPAILVAADGEATELETGGLPLGLLLDGSYKVGQVSMGPGSLLCIYSDGITEALSADDEEFGVERLLDVLLAARDRPLESIIATIERATAEFAVGMPQADDQTLLLLRRLVDGGTRRSTT